ncbi:kuzbanian [Carabus blaptoides fortunei]
MFSDCGYIISLFLFVSYIESAQRLNEYISHYEPLSYDHEEVHKNHLRVRRSVTQPDNAVHLSFQALGRDFRLRLKRDVSTFSDQLEVLGPSGALQVDIAHIYHGHLVDELDSSVFGSIIDGVFEGKIVSATGSFYVEKARHYFPPHQNFHSVIYNENHVEDPYQHKRQGHAGGCGITDDVRQWMDRIKNAAIATDLLPIPIQNKTLKAQAQQPTSAPPPSINVHENPHDMYKRGVNQTEIPHQKSKRAIRVRNDKSTCSLYIRTDPFIWKHITEGIPEVNSTHCQHYPIPYIPTTSIIVLD